MQNDNYIIDEKRDRAWNNPSDALTWYRQQVDELEAALKGLFEADMEGCMLGDGHADQVAALHVAKLALLNLSRLQA